MIPRRWPVVRELVRRDLDSRWRGSLLGASWGVLQPLGWMALYLVVFRVVLRVPPPTGAERFGFAVYLLSALLPFLAFQEGVSRGASIWLENANLLRKMQLPPSAFILTVCLSAGVLELVGLLLVSLYEIWLGLLAPARLLWLVPGLLAQFLLTLVLAVPAAILAAFLRDLLLALPFLLTVAFYLTPILYPRELAPPMIGVVLDVNPVAWVMQFFRSAFVGGAPPSVLSMAVGFPLLALLAGIGLRAADRIRSQLADVL